MKASSEQPRKHMRLKVWLPILVAVVVAGGGVAWYFIVLPFSEKQQEIRQLDAKATQLYRDHQTCVEKLTHDFKELTSKNQDEYQKVYGHCETIRKEQNAAVDEYKKLTQ